MKSTYYPNAILLSVVIVLSFASCGGSSTLYKRIVIDTYPYSDSVAVTDTTLGFYDESGNELDTDDNSGDYPPLAPIAARIDYTGGLEPGIYYIKVYSFSNNLGEYVIRVLSLDIGESPPAPDFPGTGFDEGYPDGDDSATGNVPDFPIDISLGNSNRLNKNLGIGTDVDWLRLELP